MGGVFISYRRDDTQGSAGRLYDDLRDRLGARLVFRDIDAVEPGVDYLAEILKTIGECDALVAVIGRGWIDSKDQAGGRRLGHPADLVRLEIAAAFEGGKTVIPVLIEDAVMPAESDLPEALRLLASRNALPISDLRWDYDVGRLVARLEQLMLSAAPETSPAKPVSVPRRTGPTAAVRRAANTARVSAPLVLGGVIAGIVLLLLFQQTILDDRHPTGGTSHTTLGAGLGASDSSSPADGSSIDPAFALKPWSMSEVAITSHDGVVTVVDATTFTTFPVNSLNLSSGQNISFEKVRSIELSQTDSHFNAVITLLTGDTLRGDVYFSLLMTGSNSLGDFSIEPAKVARIDFRR